MHVFELEQEIPLFLVSFSNIVFFVSHFSRLLSHVSPSGTECFLTSDMFYVEVQLDPAGQLVDVKVAHQRENPTVSSLYCPGLSE